MSKRLVSSSTSDSSVVAMSAHAQIRLPANADVVLKVLDLRGSSSATGCAYQLYMFSGISNMYHEWCAKSQPASVWNSPVHFFSTSAGPAQIVDVVFNRIAASTNGAVWIEVEGTPIATRYCTRALYFIRGVYTEGSERKLPPFCASERNFARGVPKFMVQQLYQNCRCNFV